jgi:hypothetical protein
MSQMNLQHKTFFISLLQYFFTMLNVEKHQFTNAENSIMKAFVYYE